jgi:hypothetical protein
MSEPAAAPPHGVVAPLAHSPPPPSGSGMSSFTYFLLVASVIALLLYVLEKRYGVPVLARLRAAAELCRVFATQLCLVLFSQLSPAGGNPAGEEGALMSVVVEGSGEGVVSVAGGVGSISSDGAGTPSALAGGATSPVPPRPLPLLTGLPPASDGYRPLLSPEDLRQLLQHLPSRCMGKDVHLLFSSQRDGYSLSTLYTKARGAGPTLLVVLDDSQTVFGGFAGKDWSGAEYTTGAGAAAAGLTTYARGSVGYMTSPHRRDLTGGGTHFFGSGDAFLYSLRPDFAVYRWTRSNNEFQLARDELLAFGGGGGRFGLCLDANLEYGSTAHCETYGNPPLTVQGEKFRIMRVELYAFREAGAARGTASASASSVLGSGAELAKRAISLIQERRASRANID